MDSSIGDCDEPGAFLGKELETLIYNTLKSFDVFSSSFYEKCDLTG
jgi:hypothetical protein